MICRRYKLAKIKKEKMKEASHKAIVNGLSPKQAKKVVRENENLDLIDDDVAKIMLCPDIEHIKTHFLPPKKHTRRNAASPLQILYGSIIGDIIGSRFEFSEHQPPTELFTDSCRYTDDTILSIATAKAVVKNPDNPDFRKEYIDAFTKHPDAGYGFAFMQWAKGEDVDNTHGYGSCANGSAMRISWIPAYYKTVEEVIEHSIQSAVVTHNHIEGVKCAVVFAVCVWMALNGYSKQDVLKYCESHYLYNPKDKELLVNKDNLYDLSENELVLPKIISKNSMFCNYAVPFVVRCFAETNSYEACIRKILDGFGDSDTLCAMAGGLCCAYYEYTGFGDIAILKKYKVIDMLPKCLLKK